MGFQKDLHISNTQFYNAISLYCPSFTSPTILYR